MKVLRKTLSLVISIVISFCININVFADESETTDNADSVHEFVERLYSYCLGRASDEEGLNYWIQELTSNDIGGYEAALGFFNSEEFLQSDRSNEEFVTVCYNTMLDRDPDALGLSYWVNFLDTGDMTRDGIILNLSNSEEFINLCEQYGIINRMPNVRELYPEACAILDQCGWDLRAAYDWSRDSITYVRDINVDHRYTSRQLAHRGFTERNGNCFVFSACFYELACALGYDAHQMTGHITRSTGLVVIHSWVEIDIDGTTWVFDPEFEFVDKAHRDGWYFQYGRPRTFVYQDITRMN